MVKYYKVGGCVRDEILGVKNKDIDFAVEVASYEEMRDDLIDKGVIIYQERPEFFAIRGGHPTLGGVDYTLCRKDGFYWDNRHPDSVVVGTLLDDLARRDFTVNAMAKSEDGELIDPFGGQIDLANRILRCVGKAEERFNEDPLRLLRAVRFHITRDFILDEQINYCLRKFYFIDKLKSVSIERIYEELRKCFEYNSYRTIEFFREYTMLEKIIFRDIGLKLVPAI